jgi:hypothetical protein
MENKDRSSGSSWQKFVVKFRKNRAPIIFWSVVVLISSIVLWDWSNDWPIARWAQSMLPDSSSDDEEDSPKTPPTTITITTDSLTLINQLKSKVVKLETDLATEKNKNASVSTPSPANPDCQNTVTALQKDKESLTKQLASVERKLKQTVARKDKPSEKEYIYIPSPSVNTNTESKQEYGKPYFSRKKAFFPKRTTTSTTTTITYN